MEGARCSLAAPASRSSALERGLKSPASSPVWRPPPPRSAVSLGARARLLRDRAAVLLPNAALVRLRWPRPRRALRLCVLTTRTRRAEAPRAAKGAAAAAVVLALQSAAPARAASSADVAASVQSALDTANGLVTQARRPARADAAALGAQAAPAAVG